MKVLKVIIIKVAVFASIIFNTDVKAQTKIADTIPNHSYDNNKEKPNYSPSYVVIKSRESGKILYEHSTDNGKCSNCYDNLTLKADSFYKAKNYSDAATLYTSAFKLNENKGKVKHRLSAACCFTKLNDFENAFDNLNKVVFGAKFRNLNEISSNDCYKPLQKDNRWSKLIEGINKNLEEVEQKIKNETFIDQ